MSIVVVGVIESIAVQITLLKVRTLKCVLGRVSTFVLRNGWW